MLIKKSEKTNIFLSVPKKRPQTVTQDKHTLSALKTYFCYHAYGKTSDLFVRWATYTHSLNPSASEEYLDLTELPELQDPLLEL